MFRYQITLPDIIVALLVYFVLLVITYVIKQRNIASRPHYSFFMRAFHLKVLGGISFAMIYALYYNGGGDSVAYWMGGERLKNLFFDNPSAYFSELAGNQSWENYFNHFNAKTLYPPDWLYRSQRHFFVCRITSLVCIFIPGSFFGVTLFYSFISFLGIWKLYEVFIRNFPTIRRSFRWSVLMVPSVLFWCSGVMKDTVVMTGLCYIMYVTDRWLNAGGEKRKMGKTILVILLHSYLIFSVKPYILIAFAPGWLLWLNYRAISRIRSRVLKYYLLPFMVIGTLLGATATYFSTSKGEFAADALVERAMVIRNDFANNAVYGTNRITVKKVDDSPVAILSTAPGSIANGLFRPFIWEARSPVVFLAGIENLLIMMILIYALWKLKLLGIFRLIRSHPIILLSVMFTIFLAFFVGFTTVIFGTMVRFRAPMLPFFISFLFISINHIRLRRTTPARLPDLQTA